MNEEESEEWHRRWCLHAREFQETFGQTHWCRRCGAIRMTGQKHKNGANLWKSPLISFRKRLSKEER